MNEKNLKSLAKRTTSEQREIAKKGGTASGAARRRRKSLRELLEIAMGQTNPDTGLSNDVSIVAGIIEKACGGDPKAFVAIRDTLGEKPVEKKQTTIEGGLSVKWGETCKK